MSAGSVRLVVRGIRAEGRHGVTAAERESSQPFEVDLELEVPPPASDGLQDALDYREVVAEARRIVSEESFGLVETLAGAIASRMLALGARVARVRVAKPRPALSLDVGSIAVEVEQAAP